MSKSKKVIGYVVVTSDEVMALEDGTLWFGSYGSLFASRDAARKAVKRTIKLAQEFSYDWPWMEDAHIQKIYAAGA